MVSRESWTVASEQLFQDPFLDQLRAESNCDLEKEIEQSYNYLQQDDITHLRDDMNVEEVANSLAVPKEIISPTSDTMQQMLHLAKAVVGRAYRSIKDMKRNSSDDCHQTITSLNALNSLAPAKCAHVVGQESLAENESTLRSIDFLAKVNHYISPRIGFRPTEVYRTLKIRILHAHAIVFHIHGMSGAGKSEIVRAVCKEIGLKFPVCHVQCQQNGSAIVNQWKTFVGKLALLLPSKVSSQEKSTICQDLDELSAKPFVNKLQKLDRRLLLVVEDVASDDEKALMRDLINELLSSKTRNIFLLIVTQKVDVLHLPGQLIGTDDYEPIKVCGFSEVEAIDFLERGVKDKTMAAELALELAYSPFRLFLAKAFCLKYKVSYKSYHNDLGKEDIIEKEKRMLKEYPDLGKHTYEVVMKLLMPQNEDDHGERVQFEVAKMMSSLADAEIPDIVFGALFKQVRAFTSLEEEQRQVKYFWRRLEDECNMNVRYHLGEEEAYGLQRAIIHNDILRAVRSSMDDAEKSKVILQVLEAIMGLIGKENRVRTNNILLLDMMKHMISVAENAKRFLAADASLDQPSREKLKLLTYLSRFHEVLGFAATQASGEARDKDFESAVDYAWSIACHYAEDSLLSRFFRSGNDPSTLRNFLHYEVGKDARSTARAAYRRLHNASDKIPTEIVRSNCSRFFPITLDLLKGMKTKVEDEDWGEMEKQLKEKGVLTADQIELLERKGTLLKSGILQKMYLTECIGSILHTRGRQVLYSKKSVSSADKKRYEWYTDVGLELCKSLSSDTKVKIIFEYIIQANNKLPRMLHVLSETDTDRNFQLVLEEICETCSTLKNVTGDFYEHGVYKPVSGTPFTILNALKYQVKANTKVYKRQHILQSFAMPMARIQCEELYSLAKENAGKFAAASNCMIHVGKYYAAIGEYDRALCAIEDGFDFNGHGINYQLTKNTNIYSWALHNYGRAIYASCGNIEDIEKRIARFITRYKRLQIPAQWREELEEMNSRINVFIGCKAPVLAT